MILSWPTTVFWEYFKTDKSKLMKNGVAQSGGQLYIESMFTLHNLISQISPQLYILLNCSNSLSLQRINSVPNPYKPVIFSLPNTDLQKKELEVEYSQNSSRKAELSRSFHFSYFWMCSPLCASFSASHHPLPLFYRLSIL